MRLAISCLFSALAAAALAADPIVIDTPINSVQCATTHITWTGGVPPFHVVRSVDSVDTKRLLEVLTIPSFAATLYRMYRRKFDGVTEDSTERTERVFEWISSGNLPSGTVVTVEVDDAAGNVGVSPSFTIQPSQQTGCL
ncbi:hypothetical protein C8Q77DRAFT_1157296 [Trametes polyzona]|nr:hypothetical protein C8Q77DRAFT_1157296 [Trametes polyzona]